MIDFINIIKRGACSITTLKVNDQEFSLTEKELTKLLLKLKDKRPDLFDDLYSERVSELSIELEALTEENQMLKADIEDLVFSNDNLKELLDENCIDYDHF